MAAILLQAETDAPASLHRQTPASIDTPTKPDASAQTGVTSFILRGICGVCVCTLAVSIEGDLGAEHDLIISLVS